MKRLWEMMELLSGVYCVWRMIKARETNMDKSINRLKPFDDPK